MPSLLHGVVLLLVGCGLGVVGTVGLKAQQAAPPALYVAMLEVRDAERFRTDYAAKVPDTLRPFGGRVLVGGGQMEVLEGEPLPGRPVIIQFPSSDAAKAWYASAGYGAIRGVRQATAGTRSLLVEGRPVAN